MTEFVRTDEGWVNLDAVERIIETEGKHGERATFFAVGGRRLGSGARWDPYEHNGQIVPATADQHVVVIGEGEVGLGSHVETILGLLTDVGASYEVAD